MKGIDMKKNKKRLGYFILTFFMFAYVFGSYSMKNVFASNDQNNGEPKKIEVNEKVTDKIVSGYNCEIKDYSFTVKKDGYVSITFENPFQGTDDKYWNVCFYGENGNIFDYNISGRSTKINLPEIGIKAGEYGVSVKSTDFFRAKSDDTFSFVVNYKASEYWENEFNDNRSLAKKMEVNKEYFGSTISGYGYEKDYYCFELKKAGKVQIEFNSPVQEDDEITWEFSLYADEIYNPIYQKKVYGKTTKTKMPEIGLPSGKYYIYVASPSYNYAKSYGTYSIKVNYEKSDVWEKEYNDNFEDATPIELNKEYYGTTTGGYKDEKDCYRFELKDDGAVSIKLGKVAFSDSISYNIGLYDENDDLIIDLSVPNSTTEFVLPTEGLKEGIYYVVIKSTGFESYYLDKYSLYIDYQETDFYEKGNNNSYYTATVLTLGNRYYGVTDTGTNDVSDYYMIDIEKKGNYKFSLETEDQGNSSTFWNVIIDSINGERIADFSVKGNTTGNSLTQKFEKGKYIIVVESGSFNGPMSYDPYAVSVLKESDAKIVDKVKATKVKISSAKAGSKKITLTCNKPSITGLKYEVQYKTGKGDWKTTIVDAKKYNGIIISKLTSGKTYKVRARAYYLIGETGYTGPWSATKTVKVK